MNPDILVNKPPADYETRRSTLRFSVINNIKEGINTYDVYDHKYNHVRETYPLGPAAHDRCMILNIRHEVHLILGADEEISFK